MDASLPNADLERCLAPAEQAFCLPPAAYHAPEFQALERARIFGRGWVGLGRADRLEGPGAYETEDVAGRPLILLRDKAGQVRAFANTCRHRGARLLDGAGTCTGIRCPFHAWLYRLDGSLAAAPRMDGAEGFDPAENGLVAYRAEERHGFLFISLDPAPPPLDQWLGDFGALHVPWRLDRVRTSRRWTREFACDWKAFLDVFNEYYHLPYVHRASLDGLYEDPDPADKVTGAYTSQFGATEGTGGLIGFQQAAALPLMPGLEGSNARGVRYTWLFPNMAFAAGADAVWIYEAHAAGPGRCRVSQYCCFPPETMALPNFEAKAAKYHHRLDAALDEDIPALENQQRGLASPDARQGRFCPELEPNVASFARWYAERILENAT